MRLPPSRGALLEESAAPAGAGTHDGSTAAPIRRRYADAPQRREVDTVRETPISDRPDSTDEQSPESGPHRRPVITPTDRRSGGRGETRYWRGGVWRQPPPRRRGPDRRAWVLRGLVGLVVLGGIWLLLQSLFPASEPAEPATVTQEESPSAPPEAAPAPPAAQPTAPPVAQPTAPPVADRLPGLSGPAGPADQPSAAPAPAQQPTPAPPPAEQPAPVPTPEQASDESAQDETPPTPEPIPPPERTPVPAAPVARQAPAPAAKPAAKPTAPPAPPAPPPAAPRGSSGPLTVGASVSPANPVSENAVVTVSVSVTSNGVPVPGAVCTAAVYYRTATIQNAGSVTTGPNGTGAIRIDAQGATYNRFVPVDVTCSTRSGTVTTRTGFTPVRGR